jgi:hypothetical protein
MEPIEAWMVSQEKSSALDAGTPDKGLVVAISPD